MTVDAVIFDWGGTLTPWHSIDSRGQWQAYAYGYDASLGEEIVHALLTEETKAWRLARDEHRATTLEAIVTGAGLRATGPQHERGITAYQAFWDPHTYTDPDVPELFSALRAEGVAVGVLSNTVWSRDHHETIFARDGVLELIDAGVYSSELAWTKPHPEAFRAAMDAVGVADPGRCVFVGDRLFDDIHGAASVGMRAVHVPHSDIPVEQKGHVDGTPDAVVNRLKELLALVRSWRVSSSLVQRRLHVRRGSR